MLLQSSGEHKAGAFFTELCQKEPRAPASAPGKRCEHRARVGVFAGWRDLLHGQPAVGWLPLVADGTQAQVRDRVLEGSAQRHQANF